MFSVESSARLRGTVGTRAVIGDQSLFVPEVGQIEYPLPTALFLNPNELIVMQLEAPSSNELHTWGRLQLYPEISIKAIYRGGKFIRANFFRRVGGIRGNEFLGFSVRADETIARPIYIMKDTVVPTNQQGAAKFLTRDNMTFHMVDQETTQIVLGVSYYGGRWKVANGSAAYEVTIDFDAVAPQASLASDHLHTRPKYVGEFGTLVDTGLGLYHGIYNVR